MNETAPVPVAGVRTEGTVAVVDYRTPAIAWMVSILVHGAILLAFLDRTDRPEQDEPPAIAVDLVFDVPLREVPALSSSAPAPSSVSLDSAPALQPAPIRALEPVMAESRAPEVGPDPIRPVAPALALSPVPEVDAPKNLLPTSDATPVEPAPALGSAGDAEPAKAPLLPLGGVAAAAPEPVPAAALTELPPAAAVTPPAPAGSQASMVIAALPQAEAPSALPSALVEPAPAALPGPSAESLAPKEIGSSGPVPARDLAELPPFDGLVASAAAVPPTTAASGGAPPAAPALPRVLDATQDLTATAVPVAAPPPSGVPNPPQIPDAGRPEPLSPIEVSAGGSLLEARLASDSGQDPSGQAVGREPEARVAVLRPQAIPGRDPGQVVSEALPNFECSRVRADFDPARGVVRLSGHVRSAEDRDKIAGLLTSVGAVKEVIRSDLHLVGEPYCRVIAFLDRPDLVRSEDQTHDARSIAEPVQASVLTLKGGMPLTLQLRGPEFPSYVYVDYYTADSRVYHLLPTASLTDHRLQAHERLTIGGSNGRGLKASIGPPFGLDLVVALASEVPLYSRPRPVAESAASYLADLERFLAEVRSRPNAPRLEYFYYLIRTTKD